MDSELSAFIRNLKAVLGAGIRSMEDGDFLVAAGIIFSVAENCISIGAGLSEERHSGLHREIGEVMARYI